ncbi:parasitic phase-specific protein PSP-1 [Cladophialophora carrionii]|uniref:Parasitic phase-specific protein PSP-1 n=1 Tax=Cladophialophora carrionii TaxID=86049 RepID=A0A1C1CN71_9EURO|nr:parasitic phase-specific protein PSP-1 [Cladophialophora carrionii]
MSVSRLPDETLVYTSPSGVVYFASGDNANCTVSACPIELSVYGYRPSIAASSTLIALYAICMGIQAVLGFRYKKWGFMSAMLLGCLDEILGYVGRILYWQNPWGGAGFIMQIVLITIGPVFFSAAIYVLLAQIVEYICVKHSRFPPKYFYWIFIPCDILSLILQAVGGAMSSTSNGRSQTGVDIALAGLILQVITLVAFAGLCVDYAVRSRSVWMAARWPQRFMLFCAFLTAATVLILLRCCYRVYELSEGYSRDSEALRDQPLFIALESVMVVLAAYCLIIAHPGLVFKTGDEHLASEEWIAEKGLKTESNSSGPSPNEVTRV